MAKQAINVGTAANDKKGDSLRAAFVKVNANFTELYTALGINADGNLNIGAFEFTGSVMSTTDSTAIVIDQATTITSNLSVGGDIVPQTANGGDLGSSTLPWRSLYVSNNTIYIGGTAVGLDANGNLTTGGTVVGSTPAWANITGKPTIPTSFDRLVNGAHELELVVNGATPYVTFPAADGGSIIIQGSEISADGIGAAGRANLTSAESDVQLSANATATNGPRRNWTFGTDGALTIPGDIRSEGNINIEINLTDSTLRRWQFGEDGSLTLPSVGKINNGEYDWTFGSTGNTTFPTGLTLSAARGPNTVNFTSGIDKEFQIETQTNTTGRLWNFGTDGALTIPGDIKSNGNINIDINLTDSTLRRWSFGEDGDTVFPNNVSINYSGNNVQYPRIIADSGKAFSIQGQGNTGSTALAWTVDPDAASQYAAVSVSRAGGDNLAKVVLQAQSDSGDAGTAKTWKFDQAGTLTFPDATTQTTAWKGIPGPYADDEAATLAGVALGSPYHKSGTGGQVFVRLTSPT